MIKRALVIAPHPDDEINLAGQLIITMVKNDIEVFVAYTTNGDAEVKIGNKRIYEAIEANAVLGVDSNHVIFLGYANEWSGNTHIYNASENEILSSKLGKTETNSVKDFPEFCFMQHGQHHKFTRVSFKNDLKELIVSLLPGLLIAPEFDSHPDHRAASLMFDEVMGEVLKDNIDYKPIVFKKYIHEGVWYGPKDYYQKPMAPTQTEGKREYSSGVHDLDTPNFRWSERVRFETDESTRTLLLRNNIIYKAAAKHKVTTSWYEMQRVINADVVYWNRPTNNLALDAQITASSGEVRFINDFMQYGSSDVLNINEPFINEKNFCWCPDESDDIKRLNIKLKKPYSISKIVIYEDCNKDNHIKKLKISTDGYSNTIELHSDGSGTLVELSNIVTDSLYFDVIDGEGTKGIAEIEIYSDEVNILDSLPVQRYIEKLGNGTISMAQRIEKYWLMARFLFAFKIKYELSQVIKGN